MSGRIFQSICGALALITLGSQAQAQSTATWQGNWQGRPTTVTVVNRGEDITPQMRQRPWWQWGRTDRDAFLFDFGRGGVELILDFTTLPDGRPEADIFVLDPRTQRVQVQTEAGSYTLPQGIFPRLVLQPPERGQTWLEDGKPNYNLTGNEPDPLTGEQQWRLRVAGRDGRPLWYTRRMVLDPNPGDGYPRFTASLMADPSVPFDLAEPFLPSWPYFSVVDTLDLYAKNRPIFYELSLRELRQFWSGFQTAGVYAFNSLSLPPYTDFESPFVWYRFDPSAGRFANLVIRSDSWPKESPFGFGVRGESKAAMRMTWAGAEAGRWRYSLTVIGEHEQKSRIRLGDTEVRAEPYDKLPNWVAGQAWRGATFVEATQGEPGSEGIYDYSVEDSYPVADWVFGLSETPPVQFEAPFLAYPNIDPQRLFRGFRGEYSLVYNRVPQLYRSPVDGRTHLLYAQGGVWHLPNGQVLRYFNADGDAYIDGWVRERVPRQRTETPRAFRGEQLEALHLLEGYALYSGPGGASIRRSSAQFSAGNLPVPVNRQTWQPWTNLSGGRDPNRLDTWLPAVAGETLLQAPGGRISDVIATTNGLQMVLRVNTPSSSPLLGRLEPGSYVIRYDRNSRRWSSQTATPPRVSAEVIGEPQAYQPGWLTLRLSNAGSLDWTGTVRVRLADARPRRGEEPAPLREWRDVRVGGRGVTSLEFPYTPEHGGNLRMILELDERVQPLNPLEVAPPPTLTAQQRVSLSNGSGGLIVLAVLVMVILISQWRITRRLG